MAEADQVENSAAQSGASALGAQANPSARLRSGGPGPNFDLLRRLINFWPPLLFSGIRVRSIAEDWSRVEAELRLSWRNRNGAGVIFGGTLFAMTDPFYPLMIQHRLGPDYLVWTKSAEIDFVSPGRDLARVVFLLSEEDIAAIKAATAGGEKHLQSFSIEITDRQGETIARVTLIVYVRKKRMQA
jgi:acyl-coenzyme A thioesterase PaaI-like protein